MATPAVPFLADAKQQQAIINFANNCVEASGMNWNLRQQFLSKDLAYYREVDRTAAQSRALMANLAGDPTKYQNLIVPVIMPQVESALAYLAGVFLTGYPIFGIASNPSQVDVALQMETVIADNSVQYGWVRQLIMFLRNCLKYNYGAVEVSWDRKRVYSTLPEMAQIRGGKPNTETYYEGNCLKNIDVYNLIADRRVLNPVELPLYGEYVGYTEVLSRVALKQKLLELNPTTTMNARAAFESGSPTITLNGADSWYYIPQVNPASFVGAGSALGGTNWLSWFYADEKTKKEGIKYTNLYELTTLYGKIIPSDFSIRVHQRNQPQIWKFLIVNRKVVIYCERQTNAHNMLPILIGQAIEDGLGYQTKSFLDNAAPFQYMSSALWSAAIESKRRQVFDRIFYDPSRVRKEDMDKATSVARIPVKSSAYGKPVQDSVYAFPYRDDGLSSTLQMSQTMSTMADEANGQNKVQRGQFQKGNKTKTEFVDTMQGANGRQQLQALGFEYQVFTPMKTMIKLNILQYQPQSQVYSPASKGLVEINPEELRQASLAFKVSDGLLPTDKILSLEVLQMFMQTLQSSPLMQSEFDLVGAFTYWCKEQGAQWVEDFKRQPEAQAQVMSQLQTLEQAKNRPPSAQQQAAAGTTPQPTAPQG